MIILGQTTFERWPTKPAANWASFVIQGLSLANLNFWQPTRPSFAASWSTALPFGLCLTSCPSLCHECKDLKIIGISHAESESMGLSLSHRRQVAGLSVFYYLLSGLAPSTVSVLYTPQVSAGHTRSASNPLLVKLLKSRLTAHLHSFVPLFSRLCNQLPHSLQCNSSCQGFNQNGCSPPPPPPQVSSHPYSWSSLPSLTHPYLSRLLCFLPPPRTHFSDFVPLPFHSWFFLQAGFKLVSSLFTLCPPLPFPFLHFCSLFSLFHESRLWIQKGEEKIKSYLHNTVCVCAFVCPPSWRTI